MTDYLTHKLTDENQILKLKNKAFLRDVLQIEAFKLKNEIFRGISKTELFCETSFKNDMWTRYLTSELQYVLAIFEGMVEKRYACHESSFFAPAALSQVTGQHDKKVKNLYRDNNEAAHPWTKAMTNSK